ncbi:pilus assembly protein [Vibrio sp. JC009]|uniref:TadE/TadG family type IV pilus assembly protein n=1 Tax=Vibrio sp. JC009 TaxID=2912314 RepID=UPI0023B1ED15|nr:TadE/TadG family type IV pilus assembly protein [Vibrio sp. JC009]WED24813.1 pilus assembly protein [Vibrio sp. JC009]
MPKKRKQKGLSVVEFSIVATVFFAVFFTVVDFAVYGYVKLTMQNAVREGARYAVTGQTNLDPNNSGDRKAAILERISLSSDGLMDDVVTDIWIEDKDGNPVIELDGNGNAILDSDGNTIISFGGAGQFIAIHIACEWPVLSPLLYPVIDSNVYTFTVSTAMKIENY